uniref:Ig-like domain-containing protein n=1 Tax=Castor canadensis TaxID=51338 RepID=A0A8C0VXC5_CASCN
KDSDVELECESTVAGSPPISITWLKDDQILDEDDSVHISFVNNVATLQIRSVDNGHSGRYTCQAKNESGVERCYAFLLVQEPAQIIEKAKSVDVTEKDPVTLECVVVGTPELKVKWLKDGKQIVPSRYFSMSFENNVASFRIQSVMKQDSGQYTFKVENDFGSSSCDAYLRVLDQDIPPSFTKKLTKMDKVLGSSIHMECKVSGSLPISAQWFKDGKEISTSAKYRLVCHENTVSLEVNNLELEDTANYTCKVSNVAGDDACSGILTVKEPPKFVKKLEATKIVKAGDFTRLECKITGSPEIRVVWYRNEHELPASDKYQMTFIDSVAVIQMNDLGTEDSGDFICEAQNPAGSTSCSTKVIVKEPPVFSSFPPVVETLKNTEVSLECELSGTPPFEVVWYKDKRQLRSSKKYKIASKNFHASIHILNVDTSDIGEYHCKAQNEVGSDTCICTIKLKEPPRFVSKLSSLTVVAGEPAELQASIEGAQPISVQWLKEKEEVIRESENIRITFVDNVATLQFLNSLDSSDMGNYTCVVANVAGSDECRAVLTVQGQC